MQLTVVIVNYNVEHFLEQCLLSVEVAVKGIEAEVFVVDNNSVDGSCEMVREKFPWVQLIANKDNLGFSKANNQAIRLATGRYVLLLNPDTVVEEDTFSRVVEYMDDHPKVGGLGVRMVDGKGKFLPESKRGLPTPWVAFCKISGIYRIFKQSKRFNHYYMGYLDEFEVNEVEILSGAFMLMRKDTLDQVGLLDEAFFMYGEDIDLSWRIIEGGYKNVYYPDTTIIHYKGESTKKGSLNYVFVFYQAMVIFAQKHFSANNARVFSTFINLAIYVRAALAIVQRFIQNIWLPLIDVFALTGGWWIIRHYYADWQGKIYDSALLLKAFAGFSVIWLLTQFLSRAYDRPLSFLRILRGAIVGAVIVLISYSLLPEEWRFSRALVVFSALWTIIYYPLSRVVLNVLAPASFAWKSKRDRHFIVLGKSDELERVTELIKQTHDGSPEIIRFDYQSAYEQSTTEHTASRLRELIRVYKADVVIFSGRDVSSSETIELMGRTADTGVDYKIAPPDTLFMIGSNSIDTSGDLFMLQTNGIHKSENRRSKRLLDLGVALNLLLFSPIFIWFMRNKGGFLANVFSVISGRSTWVGYDAGGAVSEGLPRLRTGVLSPGIGLTAGWSSEDTLRRVNVIYARDYRVKNDLSLIFRHFRSLGNRVKSSR